MKKKDKDQAETIMEVELEVVHFAHPQQVLVVYDPWEKESEL